MLLGFLKKNHIPQKPGIYIFKDKKGAILYVGKAIDLNHRVRSYFKGRHELRTISLVEKIADLETVIVESELEALVLEANLIKKYLPTFNIKLTDDKDYLYIKITKEDFPKIITARKKDLKDSGEYFGPYPSSKTVSETLKKLRKIFPWCSSPPRIDHETDTILTKRPCFYFHLRLCPGPCAGELSGEDYRKIINRLVLFLEGGKLRLLRNLTQDMEEAAKNLNYEKAQEFKKIIQGIQYLTQPNRVKSYLENPNFLKEESHLALKQIKKMLNLPNLPERIEGYDISNIQGRQATGSLVVLTHGEIDKSQYRKFKIIISGRPNDVGMHKEMIRRRLNHPKWPKPDLIIVDGGRGQTRGVWEVIKSHHIPIFGLAKRMEWLYPPQGEIIKLPRRSLALRILQRLRDESHRFALSYHRKLRGKSWYNIKNEVAASKFPD